MNYSTIFKFFLYSTGLIDLINGFIIEEIGNLPISLGQIYRFIFISFMIVLMAKYAKKQDQIFIGTVICYFIGSTLVRFFINNNLKLVVNDIINFSKLLLPISIIISGKVLISNKKIVREDLIKIIELNSWIIVISLLVCKVLNLGNYAYLENIGFKGYFYSNNELSIVLSLIFIYKWEEIYNQLIERKNVKVYSYISLAGIISAALIIGAKTLYLIFIITIIISVLRTIIKMNIFNLSKVLVGITILVIVILLISNIYDEEINAIIIKQSYHLKTKGLISFILSDRNILWSQLYNDYIYRKETVLAILFGFTPSFLNIELDINALYINYGLIGVGLIIIPVIKLLIDSKKIYYNMYPYIIYILFSVTAGHVVFGAFAGTFFAIQCLSMIENRVNN